MRIARLAAAVAGLTIMLAGPAPASDLARYEPARRLGGSTLSTEAVPPGAWTGYGIPGGLIFRDPHFQRVLPPCDSAAALEVVSHRFAEKEGQFWNSALTIVGYDRIRQVADNPWGRNNIPRVYCTARAQLSDGRLRQVDYAILEDQSITGYTFGVEWCVRGLDRGWSFAPNCRMARP